MGPEKHDPAADSTTDAAVGSFAESRGFVAVPSAVPRVVAAV